MKKIVFAACLLTTTTMYADQGPRQMLGNLLSNLKANGLQSLHVDEGDSLVLMDKDEIRKALDQFPALKLSFDKLKLNPDDIASIVFEENKELGNKVHYITHDGRGYQGKSNKDSLAFVEKLKRNDQQVRRVRHHKRDDAKQCVMQRSDDDSDSVYTLKLSNGDEFAVYLPNEPLRFSDGSGEWSLKPDQIQSIYQDGWLFGEYVSTHGEECDFSYAFASDRVLRAYRTEDRETIAIPWYKIASLCVKESITYPTYQEIAPKDYMVSEQKGSYSVSDEYYSDSYYQDPKSSLPVYENETSSIGVYGSDVSSSLGYEILLPPTEHSERTATTTTYSQERVFADYTDDEVPREITFVRNEEKYEPPGSITRESNLFSRYDLAFEDVAGNDLSYESEELDYSDENEEEEDEEDEIIFISRGGAYNELDHLVYADNALPQEFSDNIWDDIDADFFVDFTEDSDVDSMFDDIEFGLDYDAYMSHDLN